MKMRTVGWLVLFASLSVMACTTEADAPNYWAPSGSGGAAGSGGTAPGGAAGSAGSGGSATGGDGGSATGGDGGSATGGSGGAPTDPHAANRAACIAKINALRATKGLPPYAQWTSAETCVDGQVTQDEASSSPHGTFGQCGESGQNECLGGGIESCLESMWAEKDQPGCAGCDACADGYNPNCPNCDFYGSQTGDVCGHYVNMSAKFFTQVACGFSNAGSWAAQDYR